MRTGLVSRIKNIIVRGGSRPHVVPLGLYQGLKLEIDLQYNFQLYSGLWEFETHRYFLMWNDYGWAIDVGAGAGELCLFLLKHKRNLKRIYAVEPQAEEVRRMKQNFELNRGLDIEKVTIVARCAGIKPNEVRLDDLDVERGLSPGIIKIDVDGYEIEVLKGATALLRTRNVDLMLETHTLSLEKECVKILEGAGFSIKVIKNGWYRWIVPEQRPTEHNRWLWASNRDGA
jgi:precorrin-6B methylase 2